MIRVDLTEDEAVAVVEALAIHAETMREQAERLEEPEDAPVGYGDGCRAVGDALDRVRFRIHHEGPWI